MNVPNDRKYLETHEWFMLEGDVVTMGITQFAADELTDITYVELPDPGTEIAAGQSISEVESVKATSEVLCAVAGTVMDTNAELADHPELINDDAFAGGWMIKIKVDSAAQLDDLMSSEEYSALVLK